MIRHLLAPALGLALGACSAPRRSSAPVAPVAPGAASAPPHGGRAPLTAGRFAWQSPLGRDHPLAGRIWSRGRWITEGELAAEARGARYVLLGERHDNPDHHALQARLVGVVAAGGRRPIVAWEMIEAGQQRELDAFVAAHPTDVAGLGTALRWRERGWPAWSLYQPVVAEAQRYGLPLRGAAMPDARARAIAKEGLAAIEPERVVALGLDRPLDPSLGASLRSELVASHCGMLPERAVATMAVAQRARDAELAVRLAEGDRGGGGILIAGAGHVRVDRGVPAVLRARSPGASILSVAFIEVEAAKASPEAYADAFFAPSLPFDAVWFTPGVEADDPCEGFRTKPASPRAPEVSPP